LTLAIKLDVAVAAQRDTVTDIEAQFWMQAERFNVARIQANLVDAVGWLTAVAALVAVAFKHSSAPNTDWTSFSTANDIVSVTPAIDVEMIFVSCQTWFAEVGFRDFLAPLRGSCEP
jgi:fumarate reductase subunit C